MLRERHFSIHQQVVREEVQFSRRRNRRIEHAHRSRSRVPRIHKNLPANLLLLPVQRLKRLARHHHFPAHLEIRRQLHFFQRRRIHAQRYGPDRLHIRRHVFARRAVAARHTAHQHAIFVLQGNAQPVELMLRNVFDFFLAAPFSHPPVPFPQRVIRKRIVQAEHRPRVPHGGETLARRPAHAHRWRIRRHQFRMRRFQFLQPPHQPVVRRVRNLRLIQHVIPVFVVAQLLAQLFHLFLSALHVCHRRLRHLTSALCFYCHSERSEESRQPSLSLLWPLPPPTGLVTRPADRHQSFRAKQADFLFRVRSCERVGLRSRGISPLFFRFPFCASAFRSLQLLSTTRLQAAARIRQTLYRMKESPQTSHAKLNK